MMLTWVFSPISCPRGPLPGPQLTLPTGGIRRRMPPFPQPTLNSQSCGKSGLKEQILGSSPHSVNTAGMSPLNYSPWLEPNTTHAHTHIHTRTHHASTDTHAPTHSHTYTRLHTYIHMYAHMQVHACVHICCQINECQSMFHPHWTMSQP